jgi:hypothetical protein
MEFFGDQDLRPPAFPLVGLFDAGVFDVGVFGAGVFPPDAGRSGVVKPDCAEPGVIEFGPPKPRSQPSQEQDSDC